MSPLPMIAMPPWQESSTLNQTSWGPRGMDAWYSLGPLLVQVLTLTEHMHRVTKELICCMEILPTATRKRLFATTMAAIRNPLMIQPCHHCRPQRVHPPRCQHHPIRWRHILRAQHHAFTNATQDKITHHSQLPSNVTLHRQNCRLWPPLSRP